MKSSKVRKRIVFEAFLFRFVLFLVAFYFSTKTVRAFVMHQVGKEDEPGEFENLEDSGNDIRHSTGTKQL